MVAAALGQPATREAVAVFDAESMLHDAIDELQRAGFNLADLYVLLPGDVVKKHPGHEVPIAANDPGVGRMHMRSMGIFQWALISVPAYIVASIMIANAAANGADLGATIMAAIVGCGIGGITGTFGVAWVKRGHQWRIKNHVDHGGLLLWVIIRDAIREKRVSEILARYPVRDFHFHSLAARRSRRP